MDIMRESVHIDQMGETESETPVSIENTDIDPLDINPSSFTLEDFTPRQQLSVLTDILRQRRTEELTKMIAELLGNVSRMQITTETDTVVIVTENARLTDYVLAIFRLLDLAPILAKLDRQTLVVQDMRIDFNRKNPRFSLAELEAGMISSFKKIHDLRNEAGLVLGLRRQLEARAADIQNLNAKLELATKAKDAAEARCIALESAPKPTPLVNEKGQQFVQVRWTVNIEKEGQPSKSTLFYLCVEDGAQPNEKGVYKTAAFRRTKDRQKALSFANEQEARATIARVIKNEKHIDRTSKVTVRALNSAKVVRLMELEG
jgi:hypothetical protein